MKILTIIVRGVLALILALAAREAGSVIWLVMKDRRTTPKELRPSHWQSIKDTFPNNARDYDSPEIIEERRRALLEDEDEYLRK